MGCKRQVEWGCNARKVKPYPEEGETEVDCWEAPAMMPLVIDGEERYVCPRRTLLDEPEFWNRLLLYHRAFDKGILPNEGALQDQSNAGMVALGILSSAIAQAHEELRQRNT